MFGQGVLFGCEAHGGADGEGNAAYQGIIHDFVMLNALRETHAAEAAITLAVGTLRTTLHAG